MACTAGRGSGRPRGWHEGDGSCETENDVNCIPDKEEYVTRHSVQVDQDHCSKQGADEYPQFSVFKEQSDEADNHQYRDISSPKCGYYRFFAFKYHFC